MIGMAFLVRPQTAGGAGIVRPSYLGGALGAQGTGTPAVGNTLAFVTMT